MKSARYLLRWRPLASFLPARRLALAWVVAATVAVNVTTPAISAPSAAGGWAASWIAAPQDHREPSIVPGMAPAPAAAFVQQTLRQLIAPTLGGAKVRVRFSNLFGKTPLRIAAASVARSTGGDAISPASLRDLRFSGRREVTIAPGAEAWSDAAALEIEAGQVLAVSSFLDEPTPVATVHRNPRQATWVGAGNSVANARLHEPALAAWNHHVTGLDVATTQAARVVVAFGDSITEGVGATQGEGAYPDHLARRLRDGPAGARPVAVVNAGIGGNGLVVDAAGPEGVDRFARDVLAQSGVTHTILLIGINDIAASVFADVPGRKTPRSQEPTADRLTAALQRLMDQARAKGVKVLLGTVLPFKGAPFWTEESEAMRQAVNRWIRGRQDVDGVIDFDAALRSPTDPTAMNPLYDSGDHLHPGNAGYAAMAAAVDLRELRE